MDPAATSPITHQAPETAADPLGPDALDFWLGTWDLTWGDVGHGTNHIERAVGGRVVVERFEGGGPRGTLSGMSVSIREGEGGPWHQAWVDSSGTYLDLLGTEVDGRISFGYGTEEDGGTVHYRMVWLDVQAESLRWEWQRSTDGWSTWEVRWSIAYRRRSG
jgi:hypothetical protein